jgi:hypothetical protein
MEPQRGPLRKRGLRCRFENRGDPLPGLVNDFAAYTRSAGRGPRVAPPAKVGSAAGSDDRYLTVMTGLGSTQPAGGSGMQPMLTSPP